MRLWLRTRSCWSSPRFLWEPELLTARCSDAMTLPINDWLFHLEGGTIPPYCALHFLPLISIGVNCLCISIVFGSCLAAISNMAVQSFCRLVGHGNPAPSPWHKQFFLLAQQCFGATYEPLFLVWSWCFGCRKTKNRFETRLWLRTSTGTALVEKGYMTQTERCRGSSIGITYSRGEWCQKQMDFPCVLESIVGSKNNPQRCEELMFLYPAL